MLPEPDCARAGSPVMAESDIVTPEEPPVPAEAIRLPTRGFTIDRRKALIVAAVLWAGFGVMVWAVTAGHTRARGLRSAPFCHIFTKR